jgi:uncharacterized repeat protein (TIGR01451 family)
MRRQLGWIAAAAAFAFVIAASTVHAATVTGADLQVSGSASTGSPNPGAPYTYTFQVKNAGPDSADASTFTDALPAGAAFSYATVNGVAGACAATNGVVSCSLGTIAKGSQATVVVGATAPVAAGSFSSTGTAASSASDPQPGNNSATVTVQVKVATCPLPAGQTTLNGLVMLKYTNSFGLFENFQLSVGAVTYTVLTNFYDGSAPLTTVIDLVCKQSPVQFVQVGNFVNVTGTIGSAPVFGSTVATPVIYASVVQTLTFKDKA